MFLYKFKMKLFSLSWLLMIIILLVKISQAQQNPEQIFQAGLYCEEVQGDLEKAISYFQKIIDHHSNYRSLTANAWLHIGFCYEKLGKEHAREAYQRIISEFQDQRDVVVIANQQLKKLSIRNLNIKNLSTGRKNNSTDVDWIFESGSLENSISHDLLFEAIPSSPVITVVTMSDLKVLPTEWRLRHNNPNVFNPATTIEYSLPISASIELTIYDLQGRKIATLVNASQKAGCYCVKFNCQELPIGIYLYCFRTDRLKAMKKMVIMR